MVRGALAALWLAVSPALAEAPRRVVSLNLCTDQLAMMLAAPGQLISVSHLARDPLSSSMAAEAAAWPVNYGQAEEVFLMRPDLVLAGRYTTQVTVDMLTRLGVPVVTFDLVTDIDGLRGSLRQMGQVLGRASEAEALIAHFDADLARLGAPQGDNPSAGLYAANGYSSGDGSLAGQMLALAGFRNIAAGAGIPQGGFLPLEVLVMAQPDLVIPDEPNPGAARAEEVLSHPALGHLMDDAPVRVTTDPDWVCGTPHLLRPVMQLREARDRLTEPGRVSSVSLGHSDDVHSAERALPPAATTPMTGEAAGDGRASAPGTEPVSGPGEPPSRAKGEGQ